MQPPKDQLLRGISPVSNSSSFSRNSGRPGGPASSPVIDVNFNNEDIDKLVKGKSKRKKVGHADLAQARETIKQSEEALQVLKEREETTEKAAREAQQRAAWRVAEKASWEAAEKDQQDARHVVAHNRAEQFDKIPDSLF